MLGPKVAGLHRPKFQNPAPLQQSALIYSQAGTTEKLFAWPTSRSSIFTRRSQQKCVGFKEQFQKYHNFTKDIKHAAFQYFGSRACKCFFFEWLWPLHPCTPSEHGSSEKAFVHGAKPSAMESPDTTESPRIPLAVTDPSGRGGSFAQLCVCGCQP